NGQSTDPLLDNATARALEPLRQLTNAQEAAAASQGINPDNIVLSWTMTTQSISPTLSAVKSISGPTAATIAPTGANTQLVGGAGIADIYIGMMAARSEEHTSELQSREKLVCRLLLEKKKNLMRDHG